MSDQIEIDAAAMAIHEIVCNRSGRGRTWSQIPEALRTSFIEEARVALAAAEAAKRSAT